ncbi:hypothetical protein Pmar_PMAR013699 [Perkinsus marinus ATCC 50983]|uniref:Uncharacterized protein n=1 Tax=Perkinsus marinus (strain ATCC 50983 / TXsc) TaxID=423536 RepID=C5LY20_PERM5|nr:hypothetical protein Pmar_PMAR013699 [Perkinsus marinus ATCC 50983]EEQ98350.1 hypothetical protein Pmar_PMAR013699 [Perkinsus marinus ATCC 50983]|eukprot:XP_002765633.1 hypothetical protein Pmar_PMAR013699 [Perkinsus marinus ATCC 50983]
MTNNGSDASNGEEPSVTEFVSPSGSTLICGGAVPGTQGRNGHSAWSDLRFFMAGRASFGAAPACGGCPTQMQV